MQGKEFAIIMDCVRQSAAEIKVERAEVETSLPVKAEPVEAPTLAVKAEPVAEPVEATTPAKPEVCCPCMNGNPFLSRCKSFDPVTLQIAEVVTPAAKKPKLDESPKSMFSPGAPGNNTPGNLSLRRIQPLSMLNPYDSNWTIKVRVTSKSTMRNVRTRRGEMAVFDVDLTDEAGTQIRATLWGAYAEKQYEELKNNSVYFIHRGRLKMADQRYAVVANPYEMTLNQDSVIEECADAAADFGQVRVTITPIEKLPAFVGRRQLVDVMGVATEISDVTSVNKKNGEPLAKRDLVIVDQAGKTVRLTLWGSHAEDGRLSGVSKPVVVVTKVQVREYQGVSLSSVSRSQLQVNPETPEGQHMRRWYETEGHNAPTVPIGQGMPAASNGRGELERKTLAECADDAFGAGSKPDYCRVRGTILNIGGRANANGRELWYNACPEEGINAKVTEENGKYWCEKTGKHYDTFKRCFLFSFHVADHTHDSYCNIFNDQAVQILGCTADKMAELKETDPPAYERVLKEASFKPYNMNIGVKTDEYNEVITSVDFRASRSCACACLEVPTDGIMNSCTGEKKEVHR
eukprot:scaffold2330_cov376-Prasinococcus_capsulatus_cf.AAC.2